jgi:hypothetical protein
MHVCLIFGFGYTFQFSPIDTGALLPAGACFVYKKCLRFSGIQVFKLII